MSAALVAGLTLLAFLPGVFGEFVGWDDDRNFVLNQAYRGLDWPQLRWMATTYHMGHYKPVTWLSHGLDHALWGMSPKGYRLDSVLLHALSALACLAVARGLLRRALGPGPGVLRAAEIGAVAAALFFALHPLRVEAVTWVTGRGDLLSGLFGLLAVAAYLRACESGRGWRSSWYGIALGCFAAGLFAKATLVTLPLVLIALDVYPLRRLGGNGAGWLGAAARPVWLEKLPFAALALAAGGLAVAARIEFGSLVAVRDLSLAARAGVSAHGLATSLGRMVWPFELSPLYDLGSLLAAGPGVLATSALAVAVITAVAVLARRRWPAFLAAWAAQVFLMLPVSGLIQSGPQVTADRYTYIALVGWALLLGSGVAWAAARWRQGDRRWPAGVVLATVTLGLVGLVGLTARHELVWRDSVSLWQRATRLDPASAIAQANLGTAFAQAGRGREAGPYFTRALEGHPDFAQARLGLAYALALEERREEAVRQARLAARMSPRDAYLHRSVAELLWLEDRHEEAIEAYRRAAALAPDAVHLRWEAAARLAAMGRAAEALAVLEEGRHLARRLGIEDPEAERATALVLAAADPARAVAAWERYLAAMARMSSLTLADARRVLEGLTTLESLRRQLPAGG